MFGREHLYQAPRGVARGLVAVFPGCARGARGFWPRGPGANAACYGMPEDMSHTKQILNKGYVALVLTPDDPGLCWTGSTPTSQPIEIIRRVRTKFGLEHKPLYLLDRKSTRLNSSHVSESRMPSSA